MMEIKKIANNLIVQRAITYFTYMFFLGNIIAAIYGIMIYQDVLLARAGIFWNMPDTPHSLSVVWVALFGIWAIKNYGAFNSVFYTFFLFISHEVMWSYLFIGINLGQAMIWFSNSYYFFLMGVFSITFIPFIYYLKKRKNLIYYLKSIGIWVAWSILYFIIFGARVSVLPIGYSQFYYEPLTNLYEILSVLIYTLSLAFFIRGVNKKNAM